MTGGDYGIVNTLEELQQLVDQLVADGKPVGFDVESGYSGPDFNKRSVDHYHPDQFVCGFSITNSGDWARYIPLRHKNGANIPDEARVWEIMKPVLHGGYIVCHNIKFEMQAVAKAAGYELAGAGDFEDTMLDAYVLSAYAHANYRAVIGLKDLVERVLGHKMIHIEELFPDLPKNKYAALRFDTLELSPLVVTYACEDAAQVLRLRDHLGPRADQERPVMKALEHKITRIMADVERHGVSIDWTGMEEAHAQAQTFAPALDKAVKAGLSAKCGRDLSDLNLGSPQQIKRLLYNELGMSTTRLTPKGGSDDFTGESWERMSTGAKALAGLAKEHIEVKKLLEMREVQTLNRRLKKWLNEYSTSVDRKVHANYNQVQVGSGRFAANDPAIQQLQKEWRWTTDLTLDPWEKEHADRWTEMKATGVNGLDYWNGNFRNFIVASPDHYFLTFDYSAVELRMLAGASQEPALLRAFAEGQDIHSVTASQMLGIPLDEVDHETDRQIGKTCNFALLYQMGPKSLAEQLGVSFNEGKTLYNQYFAAFTQVRDWMEYIQGVGTERGYAETIFGRRYTVWELQAPTEAIRAKGRRVLVNAPIQGAAADMAKFAMVRAYIKLNAMGLWDDKVTIVMNQHDSLTFEVHNSIDPNEIRDVLRNCVVLDEKTAPVLKGYPEFKVDWEIGQRWGSSHKWKDDVQAHFKDGFWLPNTVNELDNKVAYKKIEKETVLRVELFDMPTKDRFNYFLDYMRAEQGGTPVLLSTPQGEVRLPFTTGRGLDNQDSVALLLGGAVLSHKEVEKENA